MAGKLEPNQMHEHRQDSSGVSLSLSVEERRALAGDYGDTQRKLLQTMVLYAQALNADRLVDIEGPGHLVINDSPVAREKVSDSPDGTIYRETLPAGCSYLILEQSDTGPLDNLDTFVVPPGTAFVLGDNRDDSMDSRASGFGPVALEKFRGKAVFIANPAHPLRDGFLGSQ